MELVWATTKALTGKSGDIPIFESEIHVEYQHHENAGAYFDAINQLLNKLRLDKLHLDELQISKIPQYGNIIGVANHVGVYEYGLKGFITVTHCKNKGTGEYQELYNNIKGIIYHREEVKPRTGKGYARRDKVTK